MLPAIVSEVALSSICNIISFNLLEACSGQRAAPFRHRTRGLGASSRLRTSGENCTQAPERRAEQFAR
jgi:hypothetical protein